MKGARQARCRQVRSDDPDGLLAVSERQLCCQSWQIAFIIHKPDTRNRSTAAGAGGMAVTLIASQLADEHVWTRGFAEADDCVAHV